MHKNYNRTSLRKLSSFSNEISFDDGDDASLMKISVEATIHIGEHLSIGGGEINPPQVSNSTPKNEDSTEERLVRFEDAEASSGEESLTPFERFIDMGQF
jgi:hypothetical protein